MISLNYRWELFDCMSENVSIQALLEQGLFHYGHGEIHKAIEIWREVLSLDPSNETAREYIEIETGHNPDLAAAPESSPDVDPPAPEPKPEESLALAESFMVGQQLIATEDFEGAVAAFEQAHQSDPQNPIYWAHVELARARLIKEVIFLIGGVRSVIRLTVPLTQLIGAKKFTQEEGFVLSLISGDISLEDIISLSPIPRYTAYQIIYRLFKDGLAESAGGSY